VHSQDREKGYVHPHNPLGLLRLSNARLCLFRSHGHGEDTPRLPRFLGHLRGRTCQIPSDL
jgi:hypothetical protein